MIKSAREGLPPSIRRARLERLDIYEISEAELQLLERGSLESLYLTMATSLLSIAIGIFSTLLSTKIDSDRTFIVLVTITVGGFISGSILLLMWQWGRRSNRSIFTQIRKRMPPEATFAAMGSPSSDTAAPP